MPINVMHVAINGNIIHLIGSFGGSTYGLKWLNPYCQWIRTKDSSCITKFDLTIINDACIECTKCGNPTET